MDARPVGFLAVALNGFHERMGVIEIIGVDPDYQGRGIGARLTEFAVEHLRQRGMDIAVVETGGDPGHNGVRGRRLVLAEELVLLEASPEPPPSIAFIAPFDSLLWDTALLASMFGFEYVWEGFFPPAKRRWGYYVLPIAFGDRFVGRMLGVWREDGFAPRRADGIVGAMRDSLRAYLRFANADRIEWAHHLAVEKRLFLIRP